MKNDFIDTLYMAKACLPQLPRHRLTDLAGYFKNSCKGAHRALNDCVIKLAKQNGKFGSFYGCCNYPVCKYTKKIT